jgi:hypothetical protein
MGLVPDRIDNIRQGAPQPIFDQGGVEVTLGDDLSSFPGMQEGDTPELNDRGDVIRIQHGDGSVTISLDGSPVIPANNNVNSRWFDNLVEKIDESELSRICHELLRGIEDDQSSRREWLEERAQGIRLLGLKIEVPGIQGASDGAPVEGMSKVRHPLLQEAVLRFQANARSELLPTDGPVKVRNDNNNADVSEENLADALEMDMNHFITVTATEYYPDTDRMLFMLGFGGTSFKKVYDCPLRNRPVSESVDAEDLIVNNAATDLANARRITHRVFMRPSVVKRLQILGVYRDIDLSTPLAPKQDAAREEKQAQQGITPSTMRPDDRDREIYECYCELDIKGFEHKIRGKDTGLEIPYRVTIDVSSRQILSLVRNYDEDDKHLPTARKVFVKYTFVPGMGFYDIGLLHILGNTTNALTAVWRELLDAGMYSCFPGFLYSDVGMRQNTNIFRVPPGGGAPIKTNGMPINQFVMPLPYKEPSAALMALGDNMAQTGMRVGGTSEAQVGEGRADAPVGTTLAMIDQATKILNAVHKRMHSAQAEEFRLLIDCFRENPEAFWQRNKKPALPWDEATFRRALDDCELTPQADPNTASHGQRVMKIMALKELQAANSGLYDPVAVDTAALQAIGWSNPQQFFAPPQTLAQKPPQIQQQEAELAIKAQDAQAKLLTAQSKAEETKAKTTEIQQRVAMGGKGKEAKPDHAGKGGLMPIDVLNARTSAQEADTKAAAVKLRGHEMMFQAHNDEADRKSREQLELLQIAKEMMIHSKDADADREAMEVAAKVDKSDKTANTKKTNGASP